MVALFAGLLPVLTRGLVAQIAEIAVPKASPSGKTNRAVCPGPAYTTAYGAVPLVGLALS